VPKDEKRLTLVDDILPKIVKPELRPLTPIQERLLAPVQRQDRGLPTEAKPPGEHFRAGRHPPEERSSMKNEYRVILTTQTDTMYTAYQGVSVRLANEFMDAVRNTLIGTGATGRVTLILNRRPERVQVVIDGAWNPSISELPQF
jgi:hypothetical protein